MGSNVKRQTSQLGVWRGSPLVPVSWLSEAGVLLSLKSQSSVLGRFVCRAGAVFPS